LTAITSLESSHQTILKELRALKHNSLVEEMTTANADLIKKQASPKAAVENKDLMLNHPSQNVINRYSSELWTIDNTTDARKSPVIGKIVIQGRSPSSRP
jgi:hypothetical protein